MPRSIRDIEQEIETLRADEADLRMQKAHLMHLALSDSAAQKSLDVIIEAMGHLWILEKAKIDEINVLSQRGALLI